jgi:ABC-type sugar transport system ATPase subunit
MQAPALSLRRVGKRYPGVVALDDVSLDIQPGSIHGLVGENGAGKSTLGKIAGGLIRPDSGVMRVNGSEVRFRSPRDALARGIALIAQELELVPRLPVVANVLLGNERSRRGALDRAAMRERYDDLVEMTGLDVPGDALVQDLSVAQQQQVEILRAIGRGARLIVMDEPTSALTPSESAKLHEIIERLRAGGTSIVYVTHFLQEILGLADTITVLRNGRHVRTGPSTGETVGSLVSAMLGKAATVSFPERRAVPRDAPVALAVRGLRRAGVIEDISFQIRAGEIVGLGGLLGSGRSEVARAIVGADSLDAGTIELGGEPVMIRSPRDAIAAGIGFVPEDRKLQGLVLGMRIRENVTLAHLEDLTKGGVVQRGEEVRSTSRLLDRLRVVPAATEPQVTTLSGGNQQKVLFCRSLFRKPCVVILDEPTRGVDVGARRAIHDLISSLSGDGIAVLLISSEVDELRELSHRLLVMRRGRIVGAFDEVPFSEESVLQSAFGVKIEQRSHA